jgi:hypothetical protein
MLVLSLAGYVQVPANTLQEKIEVLDGRLISLD